MQNRMWGQSFIIFLCHWMFLLGNGVIWKSLHLSTAVFVCVCLFVCVSVSAMSCFHTLPLFFWTSPSGAVCQKANVQISNRTLNRLFAASSLAKNCDIWLIQSGQSSTEITGSVLVSLYVLPPAHSSHVPFLALVGENCLDSGVKVKSNFILFYLTLSINNCYLSQLSDLPALPHEILLLYPLTLSYSKCTTVNMKNIISRQVVFLAAMIWNGLLTWSEWQWVFDQETLTHVLSCCITPDWHTFLPA